MSVTRSFELIESRQLFFAQKISLNVPAPVRHYYLLQIELISSYLNLGGIVQGIEKTIGIEDSTPKKTNDELVADTIDVIINNLAAFTQEDDRQEAISFLRYMMFPVMTKDSYFTVSDKTWEKINPDNFYKCVLAFGLEEAFKKAPLPNQFREKMQSFGSVPVHSSDDDRDSNLASMQFAFDSRSKAYPDGSIEKGFYNIQSTLCMAESRQFSPDPGYPRDQLLAASLRWLKGKRNNLQAQVLVDVQNFIKSVLYPSKIAHPHIRIDDAVKKFLLPDLLYEVCHEYDLQSELEAALPNWGGVHQSSYQKWIDNLSAEQPPRISLLHFAGEELKHAQENQDERRIRFYSFLFEEQTFHAKYLKEEMPDEERLDMWKNKIPQFVNWFLSEFNHFDTTSRAIVGRILALSIYDYKQEYLKAIKERKGQAREDFIAWTRQGFITASIEPITNLFHLAYLLNIQDGLHQAISGQLYPKPVLKAYREWKDTPQAIAFKAACKAGQTDKAWEMVVGNSIKVANDGLSEDPDKNIKMQEPNLTTQEGVVSYYKSQIARARNEVTKKLYKLLIEFETLRTTSSSHQREKNSYDISKKILLLVSENPFEFEADVHLDIEASIQPLFAKAHEFEGKSKALTQRLLRGIPNYLLFRMVHIYGLEQKFVDATVNGVVSEDLKSKYNFWRIKNQEFIDNCAIANRDIPVIAALIRAEYLTEDLATKKFYETCKAFFAILLPDGFSKVINARIVSLEEFQASMSQESQRLRYLAKNWNLASEEVKLLIRPIAVALISASDIDMRDNIDIHVLNALPPEEVFAFVKLTSLETYLKKSLETRHFPHFKFSDYESWLEDPDGYQKNREMELRLPELVQLDKSVIQSPTDPRLFIHTVPHPIVVRGQADSMGILTPVDRQPANQNTPKSVSKNIFKTKSLYEAILEDKTILRVDVYSNIETNDGDVATKHPYNIIQVTKADGTICQITVCDYEDHLTYVERDTTHYQPGRIIQITDLVNNPKVWTARHITFEQWFDKIKYILNEDLAKMPVQNKHRNSNSDVGEFLIREFTRVVMTTGNLPPAHDNNPIQLGQKLTTYGRIYSALQKGRIDGLENIRTYNQLFNYLAHGREGENAPMPWLAKFRNRATITAEKVIGAVEQFEKEMGEKFTPYYNDLISVDGPDLRTEFQKSPDMRRNGNEIDLAFRFGAVAIPDGFLPEGVEYPTSLVRFLELLEQKRATEDLPALQVA